MHASSSLLTLATAFTAVNAAAYQGFNYGATFTNGQIKVQSDFEAEFKTAASLDGTDGKFTSARLYTMIQGGTNNQPISAIPAAINTKTSLLLGLWASAGDAAFSNEIAALKNTIAQYCDKLDGLVAGISVGSEDLYRVTPIGQASNAGPGAKPETLVGYIKQVRDAVKGSCLEKAPVLHVDTWTAYVEGANKQVIDSLDAIGVDTYPYYENTNSNGIENSQSLYQSAIDKVQAVSGGKEIWITETGWPVSGPNSGEAVASLKNARTYWEQVGCSNFGKVNMFWYTMQDAAPDTPSPSFGLIGSQLTSKPLYDLSCKDIKPSGTSSSSASASATGHATSGVKPPSSSSASASSASSSSASSSSASSSSASSSHPTTLVSAPFPSSNSSNPGPGPAPTGSSGSGSGSGSGSQTGGNGAARPSTAPVQAAGAERMSSLGAAALALIFAVLAL